MKVKAKPGVKVPLHHRPQIYVPEDRFVDVGDEPYYRFIARDGDLIEATPGEWTAQAQVQVQVQADAKAQAAAEKAAATAQAAAEKGAAKAQAPAPAAAPQAPN